MGSIRWKIPPGGEMGLGAGEERRGAAHPWPAHVGEVERGHLCLGLSVVEG